MEGLDGVVFIRTDSLGAGAYAYPTAAFEMNGARLIQGSGNRQFQKVDEIKIPTTLRFWDRHVHKCPGLPGLAYSMLQKFSLFCY